MIKRLRVCTAQLEERLYLKKPQRETEQNDQRQATARRGGGLLFEKGELTREKMRKK